MAQPDQARIPAGAAGGGRWAPEPRGRSSVILEEDDQGHLLVDMATAVDDDTYNLTGSYSHPPIPRNPQQVVKFWLTATIPDHVLDRVAEAFRARSAAAKSAAAANPADRGWRRAQRDAGAQLAQLASRYDDEIPTYLLSDIVRLGCIYRQSADLNADQSEILVNASFTLNCHVERMSPAEAWDRYGLEEIEAAFDDTRESDLEAKRDFQAWNLHADLVSVRNKLVPEGLEKNADWVPYGGVTD